MTEDGTPLKRHNRNYRHTHRLLIEIASKLVLQSGADGVSVSELARMTGINRSTIYYHFATREALMSDAQRWSRDQLAPVLDANISRWVGIDPVKGFFQRRPDVLADYIENNLAVADLHQRYPQWDRLVETIAHAFAELATDEPCDAEDYCALMLTSAFLTPRMFTSPAHPYEGLERILERVHARALANAAA